MGMLQNVLEQLFSTKALEPSLVIHGEVDTTQQEFTCSKITIETLDQGVRNVMIWRCSGILIGNFELILHIVLMFLLLTLNM